MQTVINNISIESVSSWLPENNFGMWILLVISYL